MPITAAILGRAKDENPAKWRQFRILKVAFASLFVLVLLCAGLKGRRQVRLQERLDEIN